MSIGAPQFEYLRKIVRDYSAIVIDADKDYLAEGRLGHVVEREGFASINELLLNLERQSFGPLHRLVVDSMTNNETWFFRDFQPFEALKKSILPELMERRRSKRITFWSAACSSGQEPYSLAMSLRENPALAGWPTPIVATDLSEAILDRARAGTYSQMEVSRGLPAPLLAKYFTQNGLRWDLKQDIRKMVDLRPLNLVGAWPALPPVDILFMRNVLIYFDVETRRKIFEKIRKVLQPDGYLIMGAAETTLDIDDSFERIPFGRTAYYRRRSQ
jgi:chemotaxis protein methyltransferase CheR